MNIKQIRHKNELIMGLVFSVLFLVFSLGGNNFFSLTNIMNLFSQMAILGLLTLGISASMISGGLDLSIGALCSLGTVLLSTLIGVYNMSVAPAVLLVLTATLLCGMFNGFLVGYLKINSMLVTLGTQSLFTGIGLVVSKGITVSMPNDRFELFGRLRIGGIVPFQIVILLVAVMISILIFNYTAFGRRIYLIGSSPVVARFSGMNLKRNILLVYVFSAFMAFLAALVITSRASSGRADIAAAQVLKAVSASVFGGVSTLGGIGTLGGAILGAAVIILVVNGMDMMNISAFWQQISIGGLLLIVLALRHARRR